MKHLVILLVVLMFVIPAFADTTGPADGGFIYSSSIFKHTHDYVDNNSYVDKYSEYQKKQAMPLGAGVDAVIYEFDAGLFDWGMESINTEYKYDIANNNHSIYGVIHVNLWKAGKKVLGK